MPFSAEQFCDAFITALAQRYDTFEREGIASNFRWINSALIFTSLQECREEVWLDKQKDEPRCRFSLRPPTPRSNDQAFNEAANAAYARVIQLRSVARYLQETPNHSTEWIVDFSFSYRSIDEAYGHNNAVPMADFELILTAESELQSTRNKVKEDFLRLFFIPATIRVMIYRQKSQNFRADFIRLLKAYRPHSGSAAAHWLMLGIPTYRDWCNADQAANLPCRVYYLPPDTDPDQLQEHKEWWDEAIEGFA